MRSDEVQLKVLLESEIDLVCYTASKMDSILVSTIL